MQLRIAHAQIKRLRTTCFRRLAEPRAGNFSDWKQVEDVFRNRQVRREVLARLDEMSMPLDGDDRALRQTIAFDQSIGWESTIARESVDPQVLEPFFPGRRSRGLRVKAECTEILAPRSRLLTLVYGASSSPAGVQLEVYTMYPGLDVGELDGDVTERTGRVFFDWNHPGEPAREV